MDSNDSGTGSSGGSTPSPTAPLTPGAPGTTTTTTTADSGAGSTDPRTESTDGRTTTALRERPADVATTAGGASTVAGDETIQSPTDTGAANDPNSSHPAGGTDAGDGDEGKYVELMTGKAPESK